MEYKNEIFENIAFETKDNDFPSSDKVASIFSTLP